MKKIIVILFIVLVNISSKAQVANPDKPADALLVLKETIYDFGKIQYAHPVTHEFVFTNNSSDTLKLQNVQASCGCTTPVWKKEPVAPGSTASINVGYNAASEGPFEKLITIYYNGGLTKTMTIKGIVFKASPAPAPPNASIQLLKQINY